MVIIYVPMGVYTLCGKQISHGLFLMLEHSHFFPINNLSFIPLHACFEFLQFLAYCRSIAVLWKVHEYKTLRNQSTTVSMKRCHRHVQKTSNKANATCHSECFYTAFDVPVSQE